MPMCSVAWSTPLVSVHKDAKETELAKQFITVQSQSEEGIIDPEVKFRCSYSNSNRAPTAHMIRPVAAFVSSIAPLSAPPIAPVFTADNDVLTQDWGPPIPNALTSVISST